MKVKAMDFFSGSNLRDLFITICELCLTAPYDQSVRILIEFMSPANPNLFFRGGGAGGGGGLGWRLIDHDEDELTIIVSGS